jgi:rhamnogalacturonyl hydrolase YesR
VFYISHAEGQQKKYPSSCYQDLVEDGAWCWFSDPRAVQYQKEHNRVYAGSVSAKGDITVTSFDKNSGKTEHHIIYPEFQHDDHTVPSLLFLPDGKLMIFFTKHNGTMYYTKTLHPEDISAWEKVKKLDMGSMLCYSNPVMLQKEKNRIYVYFRGGYDWKPSFITSEDLGRTWSKPVVMVGKPGADIHNRPYTKVISDGKKRIWFAITDGHPRDEPENSIYVFYYEHNNYYQVDGTRIGSVKDLPLDQNKIIKAYDGNKTKVRSWIWDIALDRSGNPVIVYTTLKEETVHKYYYAKWNGSKWETYFISDGGQDFPRRDYKKEDRNPEPHYSGGIILDHEHTDVVYLSRPVKDVFEIFKYQKNNGKDWAATQITSGSALDNVRPFVIRDHQGNEPSLLWMENKMYKHYTKYSSSIKMDLLKPLPSADLNKEAVRSAMKKVADWQLNTPLKHDLADWTNGALYAGMSAWAKMADSDKYFSWLKEKGEKNAWNHMVRKDPKGRYHADDYCVGQMYVELYRHYKNKKMIKPMEEYFDHILKNPSQNSLEFNWEKEYWPTERWAWCDALFMGPTVWAKMADVTGKKAYLDFMNKEYKATTDYLYSEKDSLYFRDSNYFDKKEANGKPVFWGRGNGWVFAGLPIIIEELPADFKNRSFYIGIYKKMAKKLISLQDEKGFWHASMLDPESYPNPEMSSTAFFIYGLAWGINHGYLDKATYLPAVEKGWKALVGAVWPDGKLGWVQPIGENPKNVTAEMTEVYGVGGFLLAGSEVYKLAK